MTALAVRYEDRPDERAAIAAEITHELDAFRARAPWPIAEQLRTRRLGHVSAYRRASARTARISSAPAGFEWVRSDGSAMYGRP